MALDWRLSPCGWWDVEPPIRPRASYQCPGGAKGERAGTQPETELEFPTVMCLCGWSRRKQHLPGTSCPEGQGGAWPGPPRPRMAAVLTRISTGNTSESSPCALLPTLAARGRPGALQEAPLSVEVCGSCESRALMSSAREKPSRKDYSEVLEARGLVRLFAVQRCSQLTAWSCLRAVAELQGCICPSSMQELWAPPHQLCQQQHVHMDTHTVLETNSSSSILAGYILQPLQLLLFAAAFLFLPSIQKRKRSYVWYKKKIITLSFLIPLAIPSQSSAWQKESCFITAELSYFRKDQNIPSFLPSLPACCKSEQDRKTEPSHHPSPLCVRPAEITPVVISPPYFWVLTSHTEISLGMEALSHRSMAAPCDGTGHCWCPWGQCNGELQSWKQCWRRKAKYQLTFLTLCQSSQEQSDSFTHPYQSVCCISDSYIMCFPGCTSGCSCWCWVCCHSSFLVVTVTLDPNTDGSYGKNTAALSCAPNEVCCHQSGATLYRILIALLAAFPLSSSQLH